MKNKLYSLLIGIDEYPGRYALGGCVGDTQKIKSYLISLQSDQFQVIEPRELLDQMAKKDQIAKTIIEIVKDLQDGDTFLFFFSGHGAQELSKDTFKEDHNSLLESIVCHFNKGEEKDSSADYLLADKEIRYLFNKYTPKVNAHILCIFDCCHSGNLAETIGLPDYIPNGIVIPSNLSDKIGALSNITKNISATDKILDRWGTPLNIADEVGALNDTVTSTASNHDIENVTRPQNNKLPQAAPTAKREVALKPKTLGLRSIARPYKKFLFHEEIDVKTFQTNWFRDIFPNVNIITLSACQAFEVCWEDAEGGIFTRYLLTILENCNSIINYNDLVKKTSIDIRYSRQLRQTPTITIVGEENYNQQTSWLQLNGLRLKYKVNDIKFYPKHGWIYSLGKLVGVQEGDIITAILSNQKEIQLTIQKVNLRDSMVEIPALTKLNQSKSYPVIHKVIYPISNIFIEDLDSEPFYYATLKKLLETDESLAWVEQQEEADFQITIFNQCIYFSSQNDPYRPLHQLVNLFKVNDKNKVKNGLQKWIQKGGRSLSKWSFYKDLEQHGDFNKIPIRIEISEYKKNNWQDITNDRFTFNQNGTYRHNGNLTSTDFEIKVTNLANERIYVTPISLHLPGLEITTFFEESSVLLELGSTKIFPKSQLSIDGFQELYNWKKEKIYLKFLVSTIDHKTSLPAITQTVFNPILPSILIIIGDDKKGGGRSEEIRGFEKWGIYPVELIFSNPTFNQLTGRLEQTIEQYKDNDQVSPFIDRLYFDLLPGNLNNRFVKKVAGNVIYEQASNSWLEKEIDIGRRNRRFEQLKSKFSDKKIIVAVGDSWFSYPTRIKDTLDYIMEECPVRSLVWKGQTVAYYKRPNELIKVVKEEAAKSKPFDLLLSGGGSDFIGPVLEILLVKNIKNVAHPKDYLNSQYKNQMLNVKSIYQYLFTELSNQQYVEKILVHGYDYIRTDPTPSNIDGRIKKIMEDAGIKNLEERNTLIRYLIDEFNKVLHSLATRFPKVIYIDVRGCLSDGDWYNEIHPNSLGFSIIANKILAELNNDSVVLL